MQGGVFGDGTTNVEESTTETHRNENYLILYGIVYYMLRFLTDYGFTLGQITKITVDGILVILVIINRYVLVILKTS